MTKDMFDEEENFENENKENQDTEVENSNDENDNQDSETETEIETVETENVETEKEKQIKKKYKFIITLIITISVVLISGITVVLLNIDYISSWMTNVISEAKVYDFEDDTIMTINGRKIPTSRYEAYFHQMLKNYDQGNKDLWKKGDSNYDMKQVKDLINFSKEKVVEIVRQTEAIHIIAEENNIKLGEEDNKKVDEMITEQIEKIGGEEAFEQFLKDNFFDKDMFRYVAETSYLGDKIYETFYGEKGTQLKSKDEIVKYISNDHALVKHILIQFPEEVTNATTDSSNVDVDKLKKQTKEKAEKVLKKVKAGENFEKLINEYNQDPGMKTNADGYFFSKDENYAQAFKDSAFELKVGETSELVETSFGYHILKKYDIGDYYSKDAKYKENIDARYYSTIFTTYLADFEKDLKIEYAKDYDKIGAFSFGY